MDAILQRMPIPSRDWFGRNSAKIWGLLAGTLGSIVVTLFLVVFITGNPYGSASTPPEPVYIIE